MALSPLGVKAPVATAQEVVLQVIELPEGLQTYKEFAYKTVVSEWGVEQWIFFNDLITRESNWNNLAQNPKSSAFGYGQFLNSTWETVGCKKTIDPDEQIRCTVEYIKRSYETPQNAIIFHNATNYY